MLFIIGDSSSFYSQEGLILLKILLSFVGNQDPISDQTKQEGAILTIVQAFKPDYIYLFPSARLP